MGCGPYAHTRAARLASITQCFVELSVSLVHTDSMRTARQFVLAAVATLGIAFAVTGCSTASDPVASVLWNQVDDAEADVYGVLNSPAAVVPDSTVLFDQLSAVAIHWGGEEAPTFPGEEGKPIFYNFQERAISDDLTFDLFVASGIDDQLSAPGWLDSRPSRVYTCYRIEVSFQNGALWEFHRTHDYGEDRLSCPSELVTVLGDSAQYREPVVFDG